MAILKGRQIQAFLSNPDPEISGALIYGPDRGRVRERARQLVTAILGEEDNPFCLAELAPANLASDPGLLKDELMAIPFMGERKIVWLRGSDRASENIIKKAVSDERTHQALLVIEASTLKPSSPLRKVFEKSPALVTIACFEDDGKSLGQILDEELIKSGQSISTQARAHLISQLGSDRALSRSEIVKLCLYVGPGARIELDDIEAISGDSSKLTMDAISDHIGIGNQNALDADYQRAIAGGINASSILMTVTRHFSRLHFICSRTRNGQSMSSLVSGLRPPIHFKRRDAFVRQLNRWDEQHLRKALKILKDTEAQSRSGHMNVDTLINRSLLQISTLPMNQRAERQR